MRSTLYLQSFAIPRGAPPNGAFSFRIWLRAHPGQSAEFNHASSCFSGLPIWAGLLPVNESAEGQRDAIAMIHSIQRFSIARLVWCTWGDLGRAANILCYKLIYSIHLPQIQTNRFRQLQCLWIIVLSRFTMNHPPLPQYAKRTFELDQFQHLATGAHSSAVLSRPRSRLRWGYRPKRRNTAPCASWDRIASITSVWHSFCFSLIAWKSPRSPLHWTQKAKHY